MYINVYIKLITTKFTQFGGTDPVRLLEYRFFNGEFRFLIQIIQNNCARIYKKLFEMVTNFLSNFRPTGWRINHRLYAERAISKRNVIY